jgi:nucleoside-diphosphate-sugar epimerase
MRSDRKNWLITGGAGFIGSNLLSALLQNNLARQIRIVDDLSTGSLAAVKQLAPFRMVNVAFAEAMGKQEGVELAQVSVTDVGAAKRLTPVFSLPSTIPLPMRRPMFLEF